MRDDQHILVSPQEQHRRDMETIRAASQAQKEADERNQAEEERKTIVDDQLGEAEALT